MKNLVALGLLSLVGFAYADECSDIQNQYIITQDGYFFQKGFETFYNPPSSGLSQERQAYLSRLVKLLKAKGTETVFIIIPNLPDGTYSVDSRLRNVNPQRRLDSYKDSVIKSFEAAGTNIVNLLPPMMDYAKSNPTDWLRQRKDYHWSAAGMRVSALATAEYVNSQFPQLVKSLPESAAQLKIAESYQRIGDIEKRIQAKCKDFKLVGESFPTIELQQASAGNALLDDIPSDVVLLGTSFSSRPPGFGFDYFLEDSLNTPVVNAAINGGGPLGAFLDYFSNKEVVYPKLLLWEFPSSAFNNNWNPFDELHLRQAIPLVANAIEIQKVTKKAEVRNVFSFTGTAALAGYLQLDLKGSKTRSLKIKINYSNYSENLELKHTHGDNLSRYSIDLLEGKGYLKSVEVELPKEAIVGDVTASVHRYLKDR